MDRKPGRPPHADAAPLMAPQPPAPVDHAGRLDNGDGDSRNRRGRNRKRAKQGAQQGQGQARFEPNGRAPGQGFNQSAQGFGQPMQGVEQQGPGRNRQNSYQNQGGHNQGGHSQGGHNQGGHSQNGHNQGGHNQNGHNQGVHNQNGHNQGGHNQGGHNQGGHAQGGHQQGKRLRRVRPVGREETEIRHAAREDEHPHHTGSWWADRWLAVLHRFGWKGRLGNGRLYANEGRVLAFTAEIGKIKARVQGTRTDPYDVTISLKPLTDTDWDLVVDIMSCQAVFQAQLLAGEMPLDVEEAFDAAYAPLFPRTKEDINAHCSCPDWANPCKHVAAVYYVMADAFDKDPFMLFHLRGRSRDDLITMLRQARAADALATPMSIESLDAGSLEPFRFWQAGEELESVKVLIVPPALPGGIPKRLGRPPFWRSPADPITRLGEVYEAIARRAREAALNEPAPALMENGS
jgi:uncharacterized Zn finger protein